MSKLKNCFYIIVLILVLSFILFGCDSKSSDFYHDEDYEQAYNEGYLAGIRHAAGVDYADGYEEGYEMGLYMAQTTDYSYVNGWNEGYNSGYKTGYEHGYNDGNKKLPYSDTVKPMN